MNKCAYIWDMNNAQNKATMTRQEKIEALKSNDLTYRYVPTLVPDMHRPYTRHELFVYNSHGAQVFGCCENTELKCYQAAERGIRKYHMDRRPRSWNS
jgi:hypothetical protein